jgi:DNA polymerase-3 subunit epsilon
MFNWFSNNNHPAFWQNYIAQFKGKSKANLEDTRFVVFDTETTGIQPKTDRVLSIGAISVIGNTINVPGVFERFLIQEKFNTNTVEIHGILKTGEQKKLSESEAIEAFLDYLGNSILIAHHAAFDVEMINQCLGRMKLPKLKNKVLDTGILYKKLNNVPNKHYGLDHLCQEFNVPANDRHNALGDAYITAQIFVKMIARMKKERKVTLDDLFVNRAGGGLI